MDYNVIQEEKTLNYVNTLSKGGWRGDSRACEQGQIIIQGPTVRKPVNMNDNQSAGQPMKITETANQPISNVFTVNDNQSACQPITGSETSDQPIRSPSSLNDNQITRKNEQEIESIQNLSNPVSIQTENTKPETNQSNVNSNSNQPIRFNISGNQPIRLSLSSSSDSSDSSKTTTWGKVKSGSPKKCKKDSNISNEIISPQSSPKKENNKTMTSWKDISPSKSSSGSDLEGSSHSTERHPRMFRFSRSFKDSSDSSLTSNSDNNVYENPDENEDVENKSTNQNSDKPVANQNLERKCCCSKETGSPCKSSKSCKCPKNCALCNTDNQNVLVSSNSSSNDNDSPKKVKREINDDGENDYFYDEDFSVQFDTNLRETSVTPIDSDPNTTILDFPNMVTGSYLRFNGGSSNVSFNNSKASSQNASVNTLKVSIVDNADIQNNQYDPGRYDSEASGNSGSHNSTMEISSSDQNLLGSSDLIDLSDGPLFTPTPSNMLGSGDSLDGNTHKSKDREQDGDMVESADSADTNLNVNCCPRKDDYFLSFDGSHSKVSGSETDISLSFTSHDSCPGHWSQSGTSNCHSNCCQGEGHEASNELSSSEGQDECTDSFHLCFNKLSPRHKGGQYVARENLTGRVLKRLVTVKENTSEICDSSEDENTKTSTTLTAGSKTVSSSSPFSTTKKKVMRQISEPNHNHSHEGHEHHGHSNRVKGQGKPEQLFWVGIGKPLEILRKARVHSHSLPRSTKLVSWKQVKNIRNDQASKKCQSLPELPTCTSWENIAAGKCQKLSDVCESFHNKRHSASLFEFYQRMKNQSNPVSPETMKNLEQIFWPNFVGQKLRNSEMSESSSSSQECPHCLGKIPSNGLPDSTATKAYANKRIFDWLKMEYSGKDTLRPSSLGCQTGLMPAECHSKETLISPQTVTLWGGTKTVGMQFPPLTKDCSMQTVVNQLQTSAQNLSNVFANLVKKDIALQTSDFEEEEILSILSDNFEEFGFLSSNEGIAKELLSCPDFTPSEIGTKNKTGKIHRSKSADGYKNTSERLHSKSEQNIRFGRSRSTGRLGDRSSVIRRRMGLSRHYSHQSLPDIAFLTSSVTLEKDESKDSLFDAMKLDLPYPVTIATKTELEQFNIYRQTSAPCQHIDNKKMNLQLQKCCQGNIAKNIINKNDPEVASSSSGISTSSASSGIDPGYCDCRSRALESPENDLERLIFFPPHTEKKIKLAKDCCNAKRRAQSMPSKLSECAATSDPKLNKYANEARPLFKGQLQGQGLKVQCKMSPKWINGNKNIDTKDSENLYALEEEQTPVASPDAPCNHSNHRDSGCYENSCHDNSCEHDSSSCEMYHGGGERNFTESDFYRAVESDRIIVVGNGCYGGLYADDSNSSSGSSIPNGERKPLKSCLRKRNRSLRPTRSMSATDTMTLNFDDIEAKVRNHRHSFGCDELYVVSDEHGQLMMYQADDSAEPVMFYLGKDGKCHMTEGNRNHVENFGSLANFNIQASDSIHASDSSTDREGNSKRKSVSFASEVSFQSISPTPSPKKQGHATGIEGGNETEAGNETKEVTSQKANGSGTSEEKGDNSTEKDPDAGSQSKPAEKAWPDVIDSCQGSSSSSDSAPTEFHVAMDTNENLWFEDAMLEKIGLLESVSKASDVLIAHFATSRSFSDKLRLGNTAETPVLGDIILTRLCTALTAVLSDGLKHHLAGFQMFGSVQLTVWKVQEAAVEIVPQTRALCDLVQEVKKTTFLTTHQQKFDAFVFGLLNRRVLDFWMGYLREKEGQLSKFYNSGAILVHSPASLKKHYDDMVVSLQKLAVLPFNLDVEFISERALTDSKFKSQSQEMISSDCSVGNVSTNQCRSSAMLATENLRSTSMLEFSASKALNWLANATLPRKLSSTEDICQKRRVTESTNQITESGCSTNQESGLFSLNNNSEFEGEAAMSLKFELSEAKKLVYRDAKMSVIDCDPIISQAESFRSSISSQTGFTSLFSTMAARLGENFVSQSRQSDSSVNQSLTSSMTSSASSLMTRLTGIKLGANPKAYKKGVTEYPFMEETKENAEVQPEESNKVTATPKPSETVNEIPNTADVKLREKKPDSQATENRNKRVSFDIVNLFDKLLLPSAPKSEVKASPKPVSKIPVPKNRWSWNFGISKPSASGAQSSKALVKASTDSDIKKGNQSKKNPKVGSDLHQKNEHFPKTVSKVTNGNKQTKGSKQSAVKSSEDSAPPKPPRLVQSDNEKITSPPHKNKNTATL